METVKKNVLLVSHLQYFKLVSVDFTPGLLQSGHRTHVHASCDTHTDTVSGCEKKQTNHRVALKMQQHSLMMAMSELKLPMLKHSCATSMKNSMMRARCFFFTGWTPKTGGKINK